MCYMHFYKFFQTSASAPMLPPRDLSPPPLPPRPSGRRSSTVEHPSGSPSRHMFFNGPQPHHSTGIQISVVHNHMLSLARWGGKSSPFPQYFENSFFLILKFSFSKHYYIFSKNHCKKYSTTSQICWESKLDFLNIWFTKNIQGDQRFHINIYTTDKR